MAKWKILLTRPMDESGIEILRREALVNAQNFPIDVEEGVMMWAAKDVDAIITGLPPVTRGVIEACEKLKVIGRLGAGYDNVDIDAATERGIPVVYTPEAPAASVAEHTMGFMIALAKKIVQADKALREPTWKGWHVRHEYVGDLLRGKTLGLIGLGRIGAAVAKLARAFDMEVLYHDVYRKRTLERILGVKYVSFSDLLWNSDFVSIHTPLTEETRGMIGEKEISMMKDGAYLVNTARGTIVDEEALYNALVDGKLAGAAVDVYGKEPPDADFPLFRLENVIVSPHMSSHTRDFFVKAATTVAEEVLKVLKGERPFYVVNPEIYEK